MSYVEKNLVSGENVLYRAHLHWNSLIRSAFLGLTLAGAGIGLLWWALQPGRDENVKWLVWLAALLIVIGCISLATGIISRRAAEFVVTNKRVILKVGYSKRERSSYS